MNTSHFITYQVLNIAVMMVILFSSLKFGLNNTVNCSQIVAPECQGISTGLIWGTNINGTTIVTKLMTDAVSLLRGVCEVANTDEVYITSERMMIKSNSSTEDIIVPISFNYGLFVTICVLEAAMIVNFIVVITYTIYKSQRYSVIG